MGISNAPTCCALAVLDAVGALDMYFHPDCAEGRARQSAIALRCYSVVLFILHVRPRGRGAVHHAEVPGGALGLLRSVWSSLRSSMFI